MKNYFFYTFLLLCSCKSDPSECQKFKDGTFKMVDDVIGTSIIERNGSRQIEYGVENKLKIEFVVNWISDCTYTLKFVQILEDPNNIEFPEDIMSSVILTTKIIEVKEHSYIQETSSDKYEYVTKSEVFLE
jgi:hypothetical protein